jgi:hypothetical protein
VATHDERRAGNRFSANQVFSRPNCTIGGVQAAIDNVSETGFGLTVDRPLTAGQRATIAIADRRATFNAEVQIVWSDGHKAGVALTNSPGNIVQRSLVKKLVRRFARGTGRFGKKPPRR